MSFSHLGLSDKVLAAVAATGYTTPTPIQEQAIPHVLARRDVLGIAQTGTGKTAAFVLPMLTMLEKGRARARMPRTLILEPTRELAAQVKENFDKYGVGQKLNVALLIGGVSFGDQDTKLTRGVDVLIATPGRLLDHTERGGLLLTGVELLVIDEADRMLDMGFIPDIERVCKLVPFTRQTLFFTATMPPEISRITEAFLHNPERIEVSKPATTAVGVSQFQVRGGREAHEKREILRRLLRDAKDLRTRSSSATASAKSPSSTNRCRSTASASAPCMATWTSRRAPQRSINSARARSRCWSPPMSPPAASIFPPSATSSISTCRIMPTITCIASAAPAAPDAPAPRFRSSRSLDNKSIAAIERLIGQTIPPAEGDYTVQPDASGESDQPREHRSREGSREGSRGGRKPRREREPRAARGSESSEREPSPAKRGEREPRHAKGAAAVRPSSRRAIHAARCLHSLRACLRSAVRNRDAPSARWNRSPPITRIFRRSCCGRYAPASEPTRHDAGRPEPFTGRSFSSVNLPTIILVIAARQRAALLDIGDGSVVKLLDEHERTLAFAEVALGQIKSLRQTAVPRNYEIWYVYATGYNAPLNKIINETLARNGRLSESDLEQIYETYLSHIKTSDRIDKVGARVIGEIDDVMTLIIGCARHVGEL